MFDHLDLRTKLFSKPLQTELTAQKIHTTLKTPGKICVQWLLGQPWGTTGILSQQAWPKKHRRGNP